MEQIVKFDIIGKILKGDNKDWFIKIIDDRKNTGGFYIYQSNDIDFLDGYDDWLETLENVNGYIKESNWVIEWGVHINVSAYADYTPKENCVQQILNDENYEHGWKTNKDK